MKIYKLSIFLIFFSFFYWTANAINTDADAALLQTRVTGTVTDADGAPVPGVTVLVKDIAQGTVTDADGKYSINVRGDYTVLTFSFIGYVTQEIVVGNRTTIDVILSEDTQQLDEVIVVGYGTMRKSDLTGAVSRVNMEDKETLAMVTLSQALSGAMPGINIISTSGRAGADPSLNIRGQNSFSGSQSPLVVLDGAIFYGSLADINVADVESIDVLKDASAAAVYGSRSANGVIIISTKKGKEGKPRVSFNMSYGGQWITNTNMRMMNGMEYAQRLVEHDWFADELMPWYQLGPTSVSDLGGRPERKDITDPSVLASNKWLRSEEPANLLAGKETDWRKVITRNGAPIQMYTISYSGRTDRLNYFVSGSYTNEQGIQMMDFSKRYGIRVNLESKIYDWLTLSLNSSYTNRNSAHDRVANMEFTRRASPWADDDSKLPADQRKIYLIGEAYQQHPLERELWQMHNENNSVFFVTSARINVPWVKGLSYELKYSNSFRISENDRFRPKNTAGDGATYNGHAERRPSYKRDWLVDNIISYVRTFNDHSLNATLLYEREYQTYREYRLIARQFENPILGYDNMAMGSSVSTTNADVWMQSGVAYMGRLNYTYKNRYMITGTVRRDGSSTFPPGHKWATLPSVSLGWVLSDESFMNNLGWLYSKIRLSYGVNGNPGAGRYSSVARITADSYYEWGSTLTVAAFPNRGEMGNKGIKWERTQQVNLGIDYGFFNRFTGSIEMFTGTTADVIVNRDLPYMSGFTRIRTNLGKIENKGIEILLNTVNLKNTAIKWRSTASFTLIRGKILDIYGDGRKEDLTNGWFVGESIGAIYDYERNGIWQEEDLFEGRIGPNGTVLKGWYPGMWNLTDNDKDGVITAEDRKIIGNREANFRWTLGNTFNYKQFNLYVLFNSAIGGGKRNWLLHNNHDNVNVQSRQDDMRRINQQGTRQPWTPYNRANNTSSAWYSNPTMSDIYESRQFVRLQDVSLSYNFSRNQLNKMGGVIEQFQIFVSGRNLYTWTKWSGWDPEVQYRNYSGNSGLGSNDNNDNFNMRNVTAGIRLTF